MRIALLFVGEGQADGAPARLGPALDALQALGHEVPVAADVSAPGFGPNAELAGCDCAVNLVEGRAPAALAAWAAALAERAGLPCLGSPAQAQLIAGDRPAWRALCRGHGIAVHPGFALASAAALGRLPVRFPVEVRGRASRGADARAVWNRPDLQAALSDAQRRYGAPLTVERLCTGRRFGVALLERRVLGIIEPVPPAAATAESARVGAALAGHLGRLALRAAAAIGLRDFALLWYTWDGRGPPRLWDPDPRPSLDPAGGFAAAARAAGLDAQTLWAALLARFAPA